MATTRCYPNSTGTGSFTNPDNVLGNTTAVATHDAYMTAGTGVGHRYFFDTSAIPAGAVVTSISAGVSARAGSANHRTFHAVSPFLSGKSAVSVTSAAGTYLSTTLADSVVDVPVATMTSAGYSQAEIVSSAVRWEAVFNAALSVSTLIEWEKFWIDFTYEIPPANNTLFFGENF